MLKYYESRGINDGFNLSHATCYALIAYQTAYLKAHFPLEYMCALLKVTTDPDKLKKYAQEARRMRIKITNPNINTSEVNFTVVDTDINFGLSAIKGLGPQAATAITTARPFDSLEDLISRVAKKHINKKVLRALALSGALDIFVKVNRMATLQEIYKIRKDKDDISEEVKAFNEKKMLDAEVDTLGFYVSGHPLYGIAKPTNWDIEEKKQFELWGLITETRAFNTKKGDPMCIISLETLEGVKTVNVFTQVYAKCKDEIINGLIVKVKLIKDKSGLVAREIKASKKYN